MDSQCKLEHQPAQPTLTIRFRAPLALLLENFGRSYGAIGKYLGELGMSPAGPAFAVYHNTDVSDLEVEAGFPVARAVPGKGQIQAGKLCEGEVATITHMGSYQDIGKTYSALSSWLHGNGLEVVGPFSEFYLNDPTGTPAAELMTKVVMPVQPA